MSATSDDLDVPNYDRVIDDFCRALVDATFADGADRENKRRDGYIRTVQTLYRSLVESGIDPMFTVRRLGEQLGWDAVDFLEQCMSYPATNPRIRERDGVRRTLRCSWCRQRERPEDDERFFLCNECLDAAGTAITTRLPAPGILVFRSYTPEARCRHANDETVLGDCPWYADDITTVRGFCLECLDDERRRRQERD